MNHSMINCTLGLAAAITALPTAGEPSVADDLNRPVRFGLLGDLELNRPACLLLNDSGALSNSVAGANIVDLQPHTRSQPLSLLSMARLIKSEVARSVLQL